MCILAYHSVDSHFSWGVTRVTPRLFYKQIDALLARGVQFLTISDYLRRETAGDKKVALTFDDGYESIYRNAFPALQRHGVKATVFINPAFTGQYNTWDANFGRRSRHIDWPQLETLTAAGWEVGLHGMMHRDMTKLTDAQLDRELVLGRRLILERLGSCSPVLSYPFGNADNKVWQKSRDSGFTAALVMGKKTNAIPPIFAHRRMGVYLFDLPKLLQIKVFAKNKSFFNIVQQGFDLCSNLTVWVKSKNWRFD